MHSKIEQESAKVVEDEFFYIALVQHFGDKKVIVDVVENQQRHNVDR